MEIHYHLVWVLLITFGDDLKLLPVMSRAAFQSLKNISYNSIGGNLSVELFKIYELTEIVRQSSDPQLAHIFNTIREGNHTEDDVRETKSLANTDTSHRPNGFLKV